MKACPHRDSPAGQNRGSFLAIPRRKKGYRTGLMFPRKDGKTKFSQSCSASLHLSVFPLSDLRHPHPVKIPQSLSQPRNSGDIRCRS